MAGKNKSQNVEVDEESLNSSQEQVSEDDFAPDELSGEIIRPTGVVDSSEAATIKTSYQKDGIEEGDRETVAKERVVFNDGSINIPSRGIPEGPLVKVRLNRYVRFRYGQDFYELYPGQVYEVPEGVKENLRKSNYLEVV